jgi:hypothetical protein
MRYLIIFCLFAYITACSPSTNNHADKESEAWMKLFNGTDLSGWDIKITGRDVNDNFRNTFVVEDSMLRIKYDNYETFETYFGHLYYKQPFSYYKLKFDYRFVGDQTKGGASWNVRNSGIMLHSQSAESNEYGQHFPVSIELQLLGGLDEGARTTANVCTPGTAVVMGDTVNYTHCINSHSETYHGDQWVHSEAIVMGGEYMAFIVEGDTVLQFQKPQVGGGFISNANNRDDWDQFGVVDDKDSWVKQDGNVLTEGYIALQAESHPIDFKNIELLDLCGCMDSKAKNYKSYYVKDKPGACIY